MRRDEKLTKEIGMLKKNRNRERSIHLTKPPAPKRRRVERNDIELEITEEILNKETTAKEKRKLPQDKEENPPKNPSKRRKKNMDIRDFLVGAESDIHKSERSGTMKESKAAVEIKVKFKIKLEMISHSARASIIDEETYEMTEQGVEQDKGTRPGLEQGL